MNVKQMPPTKEIVPLKRKPKHGDECICGALYEDGLWWDHILSRGHAHQPHRFEYVKAVPDA